MIEKQKRKVGILQVNKHYRIIFVECLDCGCYHRHGFTGDCRDDAERFSDPVGYAKERGTADIECFSIDEEKEE